MGFINKTSVKIFFLQNNFRFQIFGIFVVVSEQITPLPEAAKRYRLAISKNYAENNLAQEFLNFCPLLLGFF